MTRIGTPAPGIAPTSLTQGAPVSALLAQLPSTLSDLALGAFLTGTVLDRGANGLTLLQTSNGVLGLKTTVPLPLGSTVTLQIQTAGAQLQAIVLSITPQAQGASPAPAQSGGAPAAQPNVAASGAPVPAPAANAAQQPAAPSTITATVIGPPGGPVPAGSPQPATSSTPATISQTATATPQAAATPPTALAPQAPAVVASSPTQQSPTPGNAQSGPLPAATPAPSAPIPQPGTVSAEVQPPAATTLPAAAQAAYQRQLNAVPAPPLPAAPPPAPTSSPQAATTPPPALPQGAAGAPPLLPEVVPTPLPTGTQVQVRLLPTLGNQPVLPQAQDAHAEATSAVTRQAAAASAAQPNAMIMATVVARTPAGQVILDSAVGRLLAPLPRDSEATAPGARLFLELIGGIERALAPQRPSGAATGLAALARNWSTLKDAMRQLQDAPGQQDAAAALDRAVPKPGPKLAQQMLSYLETAQNGVKAWLGDSVARALTTLGGQRLVEQLERDLREMQNARHNTEGDWRMTLVPLLDGRELRQIRFFERRRKQEAKRKKDESARFVVECEHSEHGAIQLDGLMHEKKLDLIVRSHEPLPAAMEHDILVLFGETCMGLDLAGQLFFQAVPSFPVNPLDDVVKEPVRVSV